jgi:hypothetical protein
MKFGHWVFIILLAAVLYWVYEANPGNIFQRGE